MRTKITHTKITTIDNGIYRATVRDGSVTIYAHGENVLGPIGLLGIATLRDVLDAAHAEAISQGSETDA